MSAILSCRAFRRNGSRHMWRDDADYSLKVQAAHHSSLRIALRSLFGRVGTKAPHTRERRVRESHDPSVRQPPSVIHIEWHPRVEYLDLTRARIENSRAPVPRVPKADTNYQPAIRRDGVGAQRKLVRWKF